MKKEDIPRWLAVGTALVSVPPPSIGPDVFCKLLDAEAAIDAAVAAERERMKALAHSRAGYEAASAAHHAGKWQSAFEMHMTRNAAMCDLIDALFGPNV